MRNLIEAEYPTLTSLLRGTAVDSDIDWAIELRNATDGVNDLKFAIMEGMFARNDLILALCSKPLLGYPYNVAAELESNLATVLAEVGESQTRKAFRAKLLVGSERTFIETRYEIAVAALACRIFDSGSVQLEAPIEGTRNNTDVMGKFQGNIVRLESTVAHDDLLPPIDAGLRELIQEASTTEGFVVSLRRVVHSRQEAGDVRAVIELLSEHHRQSPGESTTIGDHSFSWRGGVYVCPEDAATIRSIQFDLLPEIRNVEFPVQSRSVEPKYMTEDFEQPEGVTTLADVPPGPHHNSTPLSTKIHQALDVKRKQCEVGVVNVIVLGKPMPMSDNAVADALFSVPGVHVQLIEEEGVRRSGKMVSRRDGKAPFVPAQSCPDPDQYVEPFRAMSGVLLLRLNGGDEISRLYVNPNASQPIPEALRGLLATEVVDPTRPSDQSDAKVEHPVGTRSDPIGGSPSRTTEERDVRDEIALNLVVCCETVDAAKALLRDIQASRISVEEVQQRLESANTAGEPGQTRFLSPSNEEFAFELIVACNGIADAIHFLEDWATRKVSQDRVS